MKEKILELREKGMSYGQIKQLLGCSKGTISFHCGQGQRTKTYNRRNHTRKYWLKELKLIYGGKCQICGYNKTPNALDFHHSNPENKTDTVSNIFCKRGAKAAIEEAKKCVLLCRNCHTEVHDGIADIDYPASSIPP